MIKFEQKGTWSKTKKFLQKAENFDLGDLARFGEEGVKALSAATPRKTGLTANSWYYTISRTNGRITIEWCNSNIQGGWAPIAVLLQYGHATRGGGYVQGRDYINPALRPVFDRIAKNAWEEVTE